MIRFLIAIVGFGLIGLVVWLGFAANSDNSFVIWFGLAAAILAPTGIAAVSYTFSSDSRQTLAKLEKVPEIQKLISAAQSQEEKIQLLEQEKEQLITAIEIESRKHALQARLADLEASSFEMLNELQAVDKELQEIDSEIENSKAAEIVENLNNRLSARRRGDIVLRLGNRSLTLNRNLILSLPLGRFLLFYLQYIESIQKKSTGS